VTGGLEFADPVPVVRALVKVRVDAQASSESAAEAQANAIKAALEAEGIASDRLNTGARKGRASVGFVIEEIRDAAPAEGE